MLSNDVYCVEEYLGRIDYNNEEEVKNVLKEIEKKENKFLKNKLTFITETQTNLDYAGTLFDLYKSNVKMYEDIKGKDLYDFSMEEIEELILVMPTIRMSSKICFKSFINQYCLWAVSRGYINMSPTESLSKQVIKVGAENILKKLYLEEDFKRDFSATYRRYCAVDTFSDSLADVSRNTYEKVKQGGLMVLMARYGILGKKLEYQTLIRWTDINYEDKNVNIINEETGELLNTIDIDDYFLEYMRKFETLKVNDSNNIYKSFNINIEEYKTLTPLYSKVKMFFKKTDMREMSLNDLVRSRKIDVLREMAEEKLLTARDFGTVSKKFNPELSDYDILLKNMYVDIFGEDTIAQTNEIISPRKRNPEFWDEHGNYIKKRDRHKHDKRKHE